MKNKLTIFLALSVLIIACTTNAITGRSQLSLVSEESLQQEAIGQYRSFLSENKVVSSNNSRDAEMVKRVGTRIAAAITRFYKDKGLSNK